MEVQLTEPIKSVLDKKDYRVIRLQNNSLQAVLVSDPNQRKTDKNMSACALRINVGYFNDPSNLNGLSHFLQRIITTKSKKYPTNYEYKNFIQKNGGETSATTEAESTMFCFAIPGNFFLEAMQRFAASFAKPVIEKSAIARECEIIQFECLRYAQLELIRRDQLLAEFAALNHPCRSFACGDSNTFQEGNAEKLKEEAQRFIKMHYISKQMFLAVQSGFSLDELQDMVTACFQGVPCSKLQPPLFNSFNYQNSFTSQFHSEMLYVKSENDLQKLEINWCLPAFYEAYKSKPYVYVAHLLNYGGPGSIRAYLRNRFLATRVTAGFDPNFGFNSVFSLLTIRIHLTDEGLNLIEEVLEAIFHFLKLLKKCGPIKELFDELKYMNDLNFDFNEEPIILDNVVQLTESLRNYPSRDILTGPTLLTKYDEKAIRDVIDIINNGKFNIIITTPKNNSMCKKTEKWCGTKYERIKVPNEWIQLWKKSENIPEMHIPRNNVFTPDNFTQFWAEGMSVSLYPKKIVDTDICEAWFKLDNKFLRPFAHMNFYFISPLPKKDLKMFVLNMIYCRMIRFQLKSELFPAAVAGIHYKIDYATNGVTLLVNGYNDKLHLVVDIITKKMTLLDEFLNEEKLKFVQQKLQRSLFNALKDPLNLSCNMRRYVVEHDGWGLPERYNAIKNVTLSDMKNFLNRVFVEMKIQCLFQGNLTEKTAQNVLKSIVKNFKCSAISNIEQLKTKICKIPIGASYIKCHSFDNSAITVVKNYYQVGPFTLRNMCMLLLFGMVAQAALFKELHDAENLVNSVQCNVQVDNAILGYTMTVKLEGGRDIARKVEEKIENMRVNVMEMLQRITAKQFRQMQKTLSNNLQIIDYNLAEEARRNWCEIIQKEYRFDKEKKELEYLTNLQREDLTKVFKVFKESRKLSIQVIGQADTKLIFYEDQHEIQLHYIKDEISEGDVKEFRKKLPVFPAVKLSGN